MNKISRYFASLILICAVLFALAPLGAARAARQVSQVTLNVRNRSGAPVSLALVDVRGARHQYEIAAGLSSFSIPAGVYDYYAATRCAPRVGTLNLEMSRTVYIGCPPGGAPDIHLVMPVPCPRFSAPQGAGLDFRQRDCAPIPDRAFSGCCG